MKYLGGILRGVWGSQYYTCIHIISVYTLICVFQWVDLRCRITHMQILFHSQWQSRQEYWLTNVSNWRKTLPLEEAVLPVLTNDFRSSPSNIFDDIQDTLAIQYITNNTREKK